MAKRTRTRTRARTTRRKKRALRQDTSAVVLSGMRGKSTKRGVSLDLGQLERMAAPAMVMKRPRPARTRFPISHEQFAALKAAAPTRKIKRAAEPGFSVTADKQGKKREMAATMPALAALPPGAAAPVALGNFAGIPATGFIPPDCTLATGPNHILAAVNTTFAIYSKAGGGPLLQKTLTQWFANVKPNAFIFDPKAIYDQFAARWILVAMAVPAEQNQAGSWFLISVSKSSDPLGGWWNYALDAAADGSTPTNNWADYPGVGVDALNLYLTANMFEFDGDFAYAKIRVVSKAPLYAGLPVGWLDYPKLKNADGSFAFTVQPCHTFGTPGTEYFVNSYYPTGSVMFPKKLSLWALPNTLPNLTRTTVTTVPFGLPPDAVQKGGGTPLDTGDVRVLNAVFRGGSVWATLTTSVFFTSNVAGLQWFQINPVSSTIVQQGVFGSPNRFCFYPAVMPDTNGNLVVCFSRCSSTEFASMHYTGRRVTDPPGTLQASALLKSGTANYFALDQFGRNRWGDYTGIAVDPIDQRSVWFYNEFALPGNVWATWVGKAAF
jgi:hypothetical protein